MPPFSGNRAVLLELALKQTRKMFNSPCGGLKRPYLDPGAQYARNLWDWDSYWASVALLGIAAEVKDDAFSAEVLKHAKGSLLTFFDYQAPDGSMPILLDGEGVDVFETRNPGQNIGKPIHAQFALLLEERGAFDDAEKAMLLRGLRRLAECRINRSRSCPTGLFVWNTDAAIGVDDDPTAWGRAAEVERAYLPELPRLRRFSRRGNAGRPDRGYRKRPLFPAGGGCARGSGPTLLLRPPRRALLHGRRAVRHDPSEIQHVHAECVA